MPATGSQNGGRRRRVWLVLFLVCVEASDVTPFDCSRNATVAPVKKESFFDYKTSVVENGTYIYLVSFTIVVICIQLVLLACFFTCLNLNCEIQGKLL